MIIDILILLLVGIGGYFLWKAISNLRDDTNQNNQSFRGELQSSVDDSLQRGLTGLAALQGRIDQSLLNRNEEASTFIQGMVSDVLEVQAMLSNPTSAGQFGNWQLQLFFENSNLSSEHYRLEEGHDQGRPDAEVDLPGNGKIFIDAKAILQRWVETFNQAIDAEEKERLLEENTENIITTARSLSLRGYEDIEVPQTGMILMYLPLDSLFIDFMERVDKAKLVEASKGFKGAGTQGRGSPIVFVSPATMGGFLGMIGLLWRERNIFEDQTELLNKIKGFAKSLQSTATHLVKGSQHHVRAGDSFRKGYMNLSKTSELIDDLGKLTDTEDLQKGLIDDSFAEVRNVKGLTKADIENWLINNPELAEEIYRKDKNE